MARSESGSARGMKGKLGLGLIAVTAVAGLVRMQSVRAESDPALGKLVRSFRLPDATGRARSLDEFKGRKALVLVFIGAACPIANGYADSLGKLDAAYRERGVQFLAVNANPGEDLQAVAKNAKEYRLPFPVLKDAKQVLANEVGAKVTPEAFVLDAERVVRYRGRIDDQYASRARKNTLVKSQDLQDAIDAVLAGKDVPHPVTTAYGCVIARPQKVAAAAAKVTYHRDVEPVLQRRCQSCHRPGQIAPFSLLTYADAKSWASEIKAFTGNRQMPPWLAEPGHGDFQDVRRLTDAEVTTLAAWADAGAPEGNPKDAPTPKQWSDAWSLGKPDLVLDLPQYEVPASGDDEFRVFVLPNVTSEERQVVAVDFQPGNPRVVHHVVTFVDTSGRGRELDAEDAKPGYDSGPGGIRVNGASIQGVWAPGNLARFLPSGVGRPLPKGSDLLIQMHYHKTGKPETDQTKIALYFSKEPVKQVARTIIYGPFGINIPPDDARHESKLAFTLPMEMTVLNIMPHMHLLGKEMKVTATLPDGKTQDMVWVKDWDYRWQDSYRYKEPLVLPKGTKVELVAYHDNSSANPRNPSNPPKRVTFGEQTTDEMAFAIMEVIMPGGPVRPVFGH